MSHGKEKLRKFIKEAKVNWNDLIKEHLPKLEKALKNLEKDVKSKTIKAVSKARKVATEKVKEVKKAIKKK